MAPLLKIQNRMPSLKSNILLPEIDQFVDVEKITEKNQNKNKKSKNRLEKKIYRVFN